jgi:putative nucleotidyltransferase-like protein
MSGSFWPTQVQKLLLQTVVGPADDIAAMWSRLAPLLQFEAMELGSYPLMPLLYKRLSDRVPDEPLIPKLRGIYRRTLYENHLLLSRLQPTLETLAGSGINAIVLAEPAIAINYYEDLGLRKIPGLDLLVGASDIDRLTAVLEANAWTVPLEPRQLLSGSHALRLSNPSGDLCSLHRHLVDDVADDPTGPHAEGSTGPTAKLSLAGSSLRALSPTDELLRICLVGARAQAWPNVYWIADAATVVRTAANDLDWNRLVVQAARQRAALRLLDALRYLREGLSAPVPDDVIRDLAALPTTKRERLAHAASGRKGIFLGTVPRVVVRFLRTNADTSVRTMLVKLPPFLRQEWGLERSSQVPSHLARKTVARLWQAVRRTERAVASRIHTVTPSLQPDESAGGVSRRTTRSDATSTPTVPKQ